MKKLLAITALLLLVACGKQALQELRYAELKGDAFQIALAEYYLNLSEAEADAYDWISMTHFADKGLQATYGHDVPPEAAADWGINGANLRELDDARRLLTNALTPANKAQLPKQMAELQYHYDCWVEEQDEGWNEQAIASCRDRFYDLLKGDIPALKSTIPAQRDFSVSTSSILYFPWDGAKIDPVNTAEIQKIASIALQKGGADIVINGHADRSGEDTYNMELSAERAEHIVAILVAEGVPKEHIEYFAFGESDPKIPTEDGVRERANRRVEIFIE